MGGGLMQLVAYGAQDIYLTGSPQITFFKVVYRRHTNFAMESIQQTFNGSADFGNRVTCTISRNGDLVHSMWVEATLPAVNSNSGLSAWGSNVGHRLINNVELEIGGQRIDKHYADWLEAWSQLTVPSEKTNGYDSMVDNSTVTTTAVVAKTDDTGVAITNDNADVVVEQTDLDLVFGNYKLTFTNANGVLTGVTEGNADSNFANAKLNNPGAGNTKSNVTVSNGVVTISLRGTQNGTANTNLNNSDGVQATIIASKVNNKVQLAFNGVVTDASAASKKLYVPLQFWFCRNPGLALPLIALQYHEVKLNLEFESFANSKSSSMTSTSGSLSDVSLWCDYIYLDTDERRRFAQVSHEYLIEQLQFTGDETSANATVKLRLNFNHPVKELVWVGTTSTSGVYDGTLSLAKLQLNGHDRFEERNGDYFNKVQAYQHHTNIPSGNVYLYSFALKPEEHQPSGTCNFSRIDNATLQLTWSGAVSGRNAKVFAVNYNVLRVMSGMGGLAYSN